MTKRTVIWWHCFSGIAGDMAIGSLLDAGADPSQLLAGLESLGLEGWHLELQKVTRSGLTATRAEVVLEGRQLHERTWPSIRELLRTSTSLPEKARLRAETVFEHLAIAEARVHGIAPEEVHFHEVGSLDAIIDVIGTCLALESLRVDEVYASPVAVGMGEVASAHGRLPNPAPAVLELLKGAPLRGSEMGTELTTPTGAALLAGLASFGPMPSLRLSSVGYGAGARDLPGTPNVLQVVVGELGTTDEYQKLALLETNIDDMTGEVLGDAISALMAAGALDAWLVPTTGKKGRPAYVLSAVAPPHLAVELTEIMARETGTLGVRHQLVERRTFPRKTVDVDVSGHSVRVKASPYRLKAEHDDCAAVGAALGLAAREVAERAERAAAAVIGIRY